MEFKTESLRNELLYSPALLFIIANHFDMMSSYFRKRMVITRVWEKIDGSSGVHEAHRAFDVRDEFEGIYLFNEKEREMIIKSLNAKYPRTDGKEVCIWHSFKGGPHHFHIQIPADPKSIEIAFLPKIVGML